jgi:hypothetical protein
MVSAAEELMIKVIWRSLRSMLLHYVNSHVWRDCF